MYLLHYVIDHNTSIKYLHLYEYDQIINNFKGKPLFYVNKGSVVCFGQPIIAFPKTGENCVIPKNITTHNPDEIKRKVEGSLEDLERQVVRLFFQVKLNEKCIIK
jgi:hypothetical protein